MRCAKSIQNEIDHDIYGSGYHGRCINENVTDVL